VLEPQAAERHRQAGEEGRRRGESDAEGHPLRRDGRRGREAARRLRPRVEGRAPKATACLAEDWDRLVTFFRFPKEHWKHLRTSNVIESPFASLRLRTDAARRFRKVENATAMLWKLLLVAKKSFRKLDHAEHLRDVLAGRSYENGKLVVNAPKTRRAA
jgi:transposase-like protein